MKTINDFTAGQALEWAVFSHHAQDVTGAANKKQVFVSTVNRELGTGYQVKHLDNWLARRKPTPKRVVEYCRQWLFRVEVVEIDWQLANVSLEHIESVLFGDTGYKF